jgi:hypothetical protein
VRGAVRIELDLCRNIHPSNESFEPNGLGSNSAAFETDARYADYSARLGLVLLTMVIVVTMVTVFVV